MDIVGAAAGLIGGLATTYFFNGTNTGRRMKEGIKKGAKKVYDGAVSLAKKAGDGIKSVFNGIGSIFGN
ncbi:hypothetical protein ACLIA0_04655 [Bacillaceae bacterium W0354]